MCADCGWETWLEEARDLLRGLDDLPERAESFAEGVRERLEGMTSWVEERRHVTPNMERALSNMQEGAARWRED